jgi:hypothetical protein
MFAQNICARTSLNELVRWYIARLAGDPSSEHRVNALIALFEQHPGDSGGRGFTREDAYEGALGLNHEREP